MVTPDIFTTLTDEVKSILYQDALSQIDYLKGFLSGLINKLPNINNDNSRYIPASYSPSPKLPSGYSEAATSSTNEHERKVPSASSDQQPSGKKHLSLPAEGVFDGLVLGDSISNRIVSDQIGDGILVRGYGGASISDMYDRVLNTREKNLKTVVVAIGMNDVLKGDADMKTFHAALEKLVYIIHHKFSPAYISLASITPTYFHNKEHNTKISKLNNSLEAFMLTLVDLPDKVKPNVINLNKSFTEIDHPTTTDGIHPNLNGVRNIVAYHRSNFQDHGITVSNCPISIRPKPVK